MSQSWKIGGSHLPLSRTWPVTSCKGCWGKWEMGLGGHLPGSSTALNFGGCVGDRRSPTDAEEWNDCRDLGGLVESGK